jgi:Na+/melibiose symporter-like transporter
MTRAEPAAGRAESAEPRAGVGSEWRAGLAVVARVPELRLLFVVAAISSVGEGIMGTLFAPFVRDVLHGAGSVYGAIVSVQAVGGVAGGLVAAAIGHRFAPGKLLGWGAMAFGAVDLALFLYPLAFASAQRPIWPAFACMIVVGLPGAVTLAGLMTMFQSATTHGERGRVFGAAATVEGLAMLIGIGLGGWLGTAIGIVPVIAAQGGGYVLAGALVLGWSRPARRAGRLQSAGGHRLPASSAS